MPVADGATGVDIPDNTKVLVTNIYLSNDDMAILLAKLNKCLHRSVYASSLGWARCGQALEISITSTTQVILR